MKEREISLVDLLVEILLRWRRIVVCMLVGALLFAGLGYAQSVKAVADRKAEMDEAAMKLEKLLEEQGKLEEEEQAGSGQGNQNAQQAGKEEAAKLDLKVLEKQMTESQIYNVDYVLTYEKLYEEELAYTESSVLMQMDPNQIFKAELTFRITSEDMEKTYNLEKLYEDIAVSGSLLEKLAQKLDTEPAVIAELVGLENSSYSTIEGTDTLRLYVRHSDESSCQKMADGVIAYIDARHEELEKSAGRHEITLLEQSLTAVSDTSVLGHQKTYQAELLSMQNAVLTNKKTFGRLEWKYYDIRKNGKLTELSEKKIAEIEAEEAKADKAGADGEVQLSMAEEIAALEKLLAEGVNVTAGISLRYIVLGMLLAAFVYVFAVFLQYLFNNTIRATENLQELYGMEQLGQISSGQEGKKLFGFVDQWILAIRDRNRRKFAETEALELAAVATGMAACRLSMSTVYLLGCDLKEHSMQVCERLKEKLEADKLQVIILNNVLYDAAAMAQLAEARCAVLVEKAGSTLYEEIEQELELLKRQEIAILGGILVE